MNTGKKIIQLPWKLYYRFKLLFSQYFNVRYYSTINKSNLSDSEESGLYLAEIRKILLSNKKFKNFKRNQIYNIVLEHVSEEQGEKYLNLLRSRNDGVLSESLVSLFNMDLIGNPRKYNYDEGQISPSTLRYVKVASDLRLLFELNLESIAEIGCGYGGQTLASMTLNKYVNFTLFDLEDVNKLIQRYLNNFILDGSFNLTTLNEFEANKTFDLVISNYAFSELPHQLQLKYIEKVLLNSKRGYLTMNSGYFEEDFGNKMSLQEIKIYLPSVEVYVEEPKTGPNNYIVVWGNSGKLENKIEI
jgi:putative sugar O-methyltransferase